MTLEDRAEVRRAKVGTKVLAFGLAIFAVLGSFWTIVWFIRSYVEPPRVTISPTIALAARESTPVAAPAAPLSPTTAASTNDPVPETTGGVARPVIAEAAPAGAPPPPPAPKLTADPPASSGSIADRWAPLAPAPESPPPPAPVESQAAAPPAAPADAQPDEIAESTVPAISAPTPVPRRKPLQTAAVRAKTDPPLPRPRPDGPAPQSVWTAVPTTDDRYQAGQ